MSLNQRDSFPKGSVLQTQDEFNIWVKFGSDTKTYMGILALAIMNIFLKNLLMLKSIFPTFGVLFFTIGRAKSDLIIFLIVLFHFKQ